MINITDLSIRKNKVNCTLFNGWSLFEMFLFHWMKYFAQKKSEKTKTKKMRRKTFFFLFTKMNPNNNSVKKIHCNNNTRSEDVSARYVRFNFIECFEEINFFNLFRFFRFICCTNTRTRCRRCWSQTADWNSKIVLLERFTFVCVRLSMRGTKKEKWRPSGCVRQNIFFTWMVK